MSYLYAVRMLIPGYEHNPIKIGFSVYPEQRLKEFTRLPFPLEWLGQWEAPNGLTDEAAAHQKLAGFRLCGEWFFPSPQVLRFVYEAAGTTLPTILNKKKALKYEDRLLAIMQRVAPAVSSDKPSPANLPDLFDVASYASPGPSAFELLAAKWPHACNRPCHVSLEEAAELSGLEPEYIIRNVKRVFQIMNTKRYGLEAIGELV